MASMRSLSSEVVLTEEEEDRSRATSWGPSWTGRARTEVKAAAAARRVVRETMMGVGGDGGGGVVVASTKGWGDTWVPVEDGKLFTSFFRYPVPGLGGYLYISSIHRRRQ